MVARLTAVLTQQFSRGFWALYICKDQNTPFILKGEKKNGKALEASIQMG